MSTTVTGSVLLDRALWRFGMGIWAAAVVRGAARRRNRVPLNRPSPVVRFCDWCDFKIQTTRPDTDLRFCSVCSGKMTLHMTWARALYAAEKKRQEEEAKKAGAK